MIGQDVTAQSGIFTLNALARALLFLTALGLPFIPNKSAIFVAVVLILFAIWLLGRARVGRFTWPASSLLVSGLVALVVYAIAAALSPAWQASWLGGLANFWPLAGVAALFLGAFLAGALVNTLERLEYLKLVVVTSFGLAALARLFFWPSYGSVLLGSWAEAAWIAGLVLVLAVGLFETGVPSRLPTWLRYILSSLGVLVALGYIFLFGTPTLVAAVMVALVFALFKTKFNFAQPATTLSLILLVLLAASWWPGAWSAAQQVALTHLGVVYAEAVPSPLGTLVVARQVLSEHLWFGVGPNRFGTAWLAYRPAEVVSQTPFWNLSYPAGASLVLTWVVTSGVLGALALLWLLIHLVHCSRAPAVLYLVLAACLFASGPTLLVWGAFLAGALALGGARRLGWVLPTPQVYRATFVAAAALAVLCVTCAIWLIARPLPTGDSYRATSAAALGRLAALVRQPPPSGNLSTELQQAAEQALLSGQAAVMYDRGDPANWQALGQVYEAVAPLGVEGAGEQARSAYQQALALNPLQPELLLALARTATLAGKSEQAASYLQRAVAARPGFAPAWFELGYAAYKAGEWQGAITALAQALALDPQYSNARYFLGLSYKASGDREAARRELEQVAALNPNNVAVRQALADLAW